MPAFTASAILSKWVCPGMTSLRELSTAMKGRSISSSVMPSALSRLRCGARATPRLIWSLLSSIGLASSRAASPNTQKPAARCTGPENETAVRRRAQGGSTTDNGVAGPTLLAPFGPAVSLSTERSFAPNCSEVAVRVAHRLLAPTAGSLQMGSPLLFLVNAFHRY